MTQLLSLILTALLAQNAALDQPRPASIGGIVVKAGSSEPVPDAGVELSATGGTPARTYTVATSSDGRYVFNDVPPGNYRIAASRPGFIRGEYGQRGPNGSGRTIAVTAGQQLKDARISLTETGAISGRIYDRDGTPMAHAQVQALRIAHEGPVPRLRTVRAAITNDRGEYRLFWLPPADYLVAATPLRGEIRDNLIATTGDGDSISDSVSLPTGPPIVVPADGPVMAFYYPGTVDVQGATRVNVHSADNIRTVDITIRALTTYHVRGKVSNLPPVVPNAGTRSAAPSPPSAGRSNGVGLSPRTPPTIMSEDAAQGPQSPVDPNTGLFDIRGVLPGSYYLYVSMPGPAGALFGVAQIDVADDVDNVVIPLVSGFEVPVNVSIEGRLPSSEIPELDRIRVALVRPGINSFLGAQPVPGQANSNQVIRGVTPGEYNFYMSQQGEPVGYLKSVRMDGVDIRAGLHFDRPPGRPIEVVVGVGSGTVSGTVIDSRQDPVGDVTVVILPNGGGGGPAGSTDPSGHFQIAKIPPGDYKVYAWEDVPRYAWQDPEFMKRYENRGKAVHIDDGINQTLQVTVIPVDVN